MTDSMDGLLPIINLADFVDQARKMHGWRWFIAGGGILTLGFMHKVAVNLWNIARKTAEEVDFITPMAVTALLTLLLVFYKPFCMATIGIVTHMGDTSGDLDQVVKTFAARMEAFYKWRESHTGGWNAVSPWGWLMQGVTGLLYLLVEGWVTFLRAAQAYTLACVITFGPF